MDRQKTIVIIDALVHGVHPITGDALRNEETFLDRHIKEALDCALRLLKYQQIKDNTSILDWDEPRLCDLAEWYMNGLSIDEIAAITHKQPSSIKRRLSKTGLIEDVE